MPKGETVLTQQHSFGARGLCNIHKIVFLPQGMALLHWQVLLPPLNFEVYTRELHFCH